MDDHLPLSWQRIDGIAPDYHELRLRVSRCSWIPFANIPYCFDLPTLYEDINSTFNTSFIIRGCNPSISELFISRHHDTLRTGMEAVLDLANGTHFESRRIRAALKRGNRHGKVREVKLHENNLARLENLRRQSSHATKPRLRYLFRQPSAYASRCFIFLSATDEWLAGITLSRTSNKAFHTELMLRQHHAPGDIMECLIAGIADRLHDEGITELSLGEAPFILDNTDKEPHTRLERLLISIAASYKHAYNYQGLYNFKNKFNPAWRPVRICAGSGVKLTPLLLAELSFASGVTELVASSTFG